MQLHESIALYEYIVHNHVGAPPYAVKLCEDAITAYREGWDEGILIALPPEARIPCAVTMPDSPLKGLPIGFIFDIFHLRELLAFFDENEEEIDARASEYEERERRIGIDQVLEEDD